MVELRSKKIDGAIKVGRLQQLSFAPAGNTTEQRCIINEHPVKYSNNCYTFIARQFVEIGRGDTRAIISRDRSVKTAVLTCKNVCHDGKNPMDTVIRKYRPPLIGAIN